MLWNRKIEGRPLPEGFLAWQVELRAHTMEERNGAPHVGVAPLLTVRRPGFSLGVTTHSIICGLLPRPEDLAWKTGDFENLYETYAAQGSRAVYEQGIEYLRGYYRDPEDFDRTSLTTLLGRKSALATALTADSRCQLLFYVFNLDPGIERERLRCLQLECRAELLGSGPVYDNVWWHNTLFHGKAEEVYVVRFHHLKSHDTRFGRLEAVA